MEYNGIEEIANKYKHTILHYIGIVAYPFIEDSSGGTVVVYRIASAGICIIFFAECCP